MAAAALVLLLLVGGGVPIVVAGDRRVEKLPSGSVMEVETFAGVPKWRLLPHLFSEKTVNVTCPGLTVCFRSLFRTSSPRSVYTCHRAVQ